MTPKWGFGVAMLPVGALCFYQVHFGRTVLPKWPLWAHFFYSVFAVSPSLERACFRQACLTSRASARRIVLCSGVCIFFPVPPNPTCDRSHIFGLRFSDYHSNRHVYQTNSPECDVGNGINYLRPKKSA